MPNSNYPWQRFWVPRGSDFPLDSDGFLLDHALNERRTLGKVALLRSTETLESDCVAFLGEPSSGKSKTIGVEGLDRNAIEELAKRQGDLALWIDLRDFDSGTHFRDAIASEAPIRTWQTQKHQRLFLFLDSLDECRLSIPTISNLIIRQLRLLPIDRLKLRIVCRTGEWPTFLELELQKLYRRQLSILELAPLRRRDVVTAAEAGGINASDFMSRIRQLNAAPFARKPATLTSLLNAFKRGENLPVTQWELYENETRALCEEYNMSRIAARKTGDYSPAELLVIASRLAALSIFCNRSLLSYEASTELEASGALSKIEMAGGQENADAVPFDVSQKAVSQTLETALFASAGVGVLRWETRNVAEFLAAKYVLDHNLNLPKILSLIVHPRDNAQKLVPQLHNTAAWLAEKSDAVFEHIAYREVQLLLSLDPATLTDSRKRLIVEQMLAQAQRANLQLRWGSRSDYQKLSYEGIGELLRETVLDPDIPLQAKIVAAEIAIACRVSAITKVFQYLAFEPSTPNLLRVLVVLGIAQFGDHEARGTVRRLLDDGTASSWPDDELLGAILQALWPAHLSFRELLAVKTHLKQPNTMGLFSIFIRDFIAENLSLTDLPEALTWIEQNASSTARWSADQECMRKLFTKGLDHLADPEVRRLLGSIAYKRIRMHEELLPGEGFLPNGRQSAFEKKTEARRVLIAEILSRFGDPNRDWTFLYSARSLLRISDFKWMLDLGRSHSDANVRISCSHLVPRLLDMTPENIRAFYGAMQDWPELRVNGAFLIEPIELDSSLAQELRTSYEYDRRAKKSREDEFNRTLLSTEELLIRGNVEDWIQIAWNLESTGDEDGGNSTLLSLTRSKGWLSFAYETKRAGIEAAKRYIVSADAQNSEWFETQAWPFYAVAGFKALVLVCELEPEFLDTLTADDWGKWIPIVISYFREGIQSIANELVRRAYESNPVELVRSVKSRVYSEARNSGYILVLTNVQHICDGSIGAELYQILITDSLPDTAHNMLLEYLLQKNSDAAFRYALEVIEKYAKHHHSPERSQVAARLLLSRKPRESWSVLWEIFQADDEFGKRVIENYQSWERTSLTSVLNEKELGQLFRWMVARYPYANDEAQAGPVTGTYVAARFRDETLHRLVAFGTYEAIRVLESLRQDLPSFPWAYYLAQADARTRESTWDPPSPRDVIALASNSTSRFVRNADELMYVVLEALTKIQLDLYAETPAVSELWNYTLGRNRQHTPKDEADLSNWLKRRLQEAIPKKGVILGREVEIRQPMASLGERTDIYIAATSDKDSEKVIMIVEVKGCWNAELKESMKTQLVERYLKRNFYTHGIYVVGWYVCPQWSNADSRKRILSFADHSQATDYFSHQAKLLSTHNIRVESFVLDASLRRPKAKIKRKSKNFKRTSQFKT
jgi:hypothetical protein